MSWFVSNPSDEIFSYAMMYLKTVSWFFLPLAMIFLYRNALQGLGEGLVPMLSGVIELVCRFVAIALLQKPLGYQGICLADPAAWVGAGIPLMITYITVSYTHLDVYKRQGVYKSYAFNIFVRRLPLCEIMLVILDIM